MKRFVNARLPLILAVALSAGILLGYLFIRFDISLFYNIAAVPAAAVIFVFCIIFSRKKLLIFSIAAITVLALGILGGYLRLDGFGTRELVNGDTYTISATVCEKGKHDGGEYVIVKNAEANGQKIKGKIKVYLSDAYGEYCDTGYKIKFTTSVTAYDTFPYGRLNYNALKNVKYRCNVYGGLTSSYRFSLFGSVNNAIRSALYNNLDGDTAAVAYAMLTGNTDGIEDETLTAFRYGGVAHIFAVSGLHVGIIYGLLRAISRRLHFNKYAAFAVCILPIFLYSGVCGFSPSSVRALITCMAAAGARISFAKYDALNSLSLSAIIILFINPLNLFNAGFQLSVCAAGGIALLSKSLARALRKLPKKLNGGIAVSLSAQAGTLPVMLARFGYLSGAGLLLNIIIVPLLSVVFAMLFISTLLSLILPFAAEFILPYAALPLELTVSALTSTGFEKSLISGFGAGAFALIYFLGLFALSDKLNLKLKYRLTAVICAAAVLCVYVPVKSFSPFSGYKIIVSAYYGGGEVLVKSKNESILIITENLYQTQTDSFLNRHYSTNIDALIILGGEDCVAAYGSSEFKCDAYVYGGYLSIQPFKDKTVRYENSFSLGGVNFQFSDGYSLTAQCGDGSFEICTEYIEINSETTVSFNDRSFKSCVYNDGDFVFKL